MTAPLPRDEDARLRALRECDVLDTPPEDDFDEVTRLAAHICGVPIAAVSLIDADRQWLKSVVGLPTGETPRDTAFCAHTILQDGILTIPDAHLDARFADNPLVTGDPGIRFYAGAPLVTGDGHALGSLCVIDRTPRRLTAGQQEALRLLARLVTSQLERSRRAAERGRAEAERLQLEAERLRLAAIIETSDDAIYSMTRAGCITSWNRGAERLYGYEAAEMVGRQVALLVPPELRAELESILAAVEGGAASVPLETVRLTKTGARLEVSLRASPVLDSQGGVVGASMIARDVTERKRADEALHNEREFTHALLESIQEGIVACDAQGTLTLFNRAARDLHGLPAEPLPAEEWADHFDLYAADGVTPMQTRDIPLFRAFQGETVRDIEMVVSPRSEPARTLLASGQPIRDGAGRNLGAVVAMHDITERRRAERELARMAAIVESSEEAILAVTLDGTIASWNRGAERLYGYGASEMVGRDATVLAGPGEPHLIPAIVTRLIRGEAVEAMEVARVRRDGTEFHTSLSFSPLRDAGGHLIGLSCIARDITARKRAEAALAESEARLRRLTDAAFEGIAISQDGTLVDVSPAFAALFGYADPAEMVGLAAGLLASPESIALVLQKITDCDEGLYEATLRRRDDSRFLAEVRGRRIHLGGRLARVTVIRDISEQRAMEADLREQAEQLRRNEAALRAVLESAPVILYAADVGGTVTLSEGTGLTALGLKPGEAVGRSVFDFSAGDAEIEAKTRRALAGEAVTYDAHVYGLSLHTEVRPLRDADGTPAAIIGVCFDVTERVASEERFRVLFERSSDAHLLVGEGGIVDCNNAAVALLCCEDKSQLMSLHPSVLSPEFQPDGRCSHEKGMAMEELARRSGFQRFEWTHRRMGGEEFPVEVALTPVTLADRPVMLAVLHDLTERKRAEEAIRDHAVVLEFQKRALEQANAELEALATTDGMTGLKNHRAFQEQLAEEVSRAGRYQTPLSLVLLDVDHFKGFNDAFGHPAGDAVLKDVAGILQGSARETDLVARYGGEEFVLLLPQTDAAGAVLFAERLRAAIEAAPWPLRSVTASFGVACLRPGVEEGGSFIARADEALYLSKKAGRNRVTVSGASALLARAEQVMSNAH